MELEKNKKYFGIHKNEIIEIEVIRKNKTSYSVIINNKKNDTLYFNEKEFYFKVIQNVLYNRKHLVPEIVKIVTPKEASLFNFNKEMNAYDKKICSLKKEIEKLEQDMNEISKKKELSKRNFEEFMNKNF